VEFRIETAKPQDFTVHLRIPGWAARSPKVRVNGKTWNGAGTPRTFEDIRRKWKDGDTIELDLPLTVRRQAIDDRNKDIVAAMKGPLMMVAVDPPADAFSEIAATSELDGRFKPFYEIKGETYSTYFRQR
jgi:hypothetical protein